MSDTLLTIPVIAPRPPHCPVCARRITETNAVWMNTVLICNHCFEHVAEDGRRRLLVQCNMLGGTGTVKRIREHWIYMPGEEYKGPIGHHPDIKLIRKFQEMDDRPFPW